MPQFEPLPLQEAIARSATGKRAEITKEYLAYVEQLAEGQAGRLRATEGETTSAVRRRLGAAAKVAGKDLVIKRSGEDIYFWVQPGAPPAGRRRRGRPRKATAV